MAIWVFWTKERSLYTRFYTGAPAGEAGGDMKGEGVRAGGGLRRCRRGDDEQGGDIIDNSGCRCWWRLARVV